VNSQIISLLVTIETDRRKDLFPILADMFDELGQTTRAAMLRDKKRSFKKLLYAAKFEAPKFYCDIKDKDGYINYDDIAATFGELVEQGKSDDYQGDEWFLLKRVTDKGVEYGFLEQGFGSCSGCDALQACGTEHEYNELINEMFLRIKWDSAPNLLAWFETYDWTGHWSGSSEECRQFIKESIEHLKAAQT
jgi:hypothetical protein